MITVKILAKPASLERLRVRAPIIVEALMQKMDLMMGFLKAKVKGDTIPRFFKTTDVIAASVAKLPTRIEGSKIIGSVTAGGELTTKETQGGANAGPRVDWAGVQERGVDHEWVINPVLFANAQAIKVRQRLRNGDLPEALAFMWNGKQMILRRVTHPALAARPFMRTALEEMIPEIKAGLEETFKREIGL